MEFSRVNNLLVCKCKNDPIHFETVPGTNLLRAVIHQNFRLLFDEFKLKLIDSSAHRTLAENMFKNKPIKIILKDSFDVFPTFNSMIEIGIQSLNGTKYACCVEQIQTNVNKCLFVDISKSASNSTQHTDTTKAASKAKLNEINLLYGKLKRLVVRRQLIMILLFLVLTFLTIFMLYKLCSLKEVNKELEYHSPENPIIFTVGNQNPNEIAGSQTEKQLKNIHQSSNLNPKRLNFNNYSSEHFVDTPPPTYSEYISEEETCKANKKMKF